MSFIFSTRYNLSSYQGLVYSYNMHQNPIEVGRRRMGLQVEICVFPGAQGYLQGFCCVSGAWRIGVEGEGAGA